MSYIETAIKEAVRGGWKYQGQEHTNATVRKNDVKVYMKNADDYKIYIPFRDFFLDSYFWQCLGKARGWGEEMVLIDEIDHPKEWCYYNHCAICGEVVSGELQECGNECSTDNAPIKSWNYEWHRFIDHLASGRDAESFFKKLLHTKE